MIRFIIINHPLWQNKTTDDIFRGYNRKILLQNPLFYFYLQPEASV